MRELLLPGLLFVCIARMAVGEAAGPSPAPQAQIGGSRAPDGRPAQCDLPAERHLKNKSGSDGAGLCVFTSVELAADWQNEPALAGFRDWMTRRPGGGWPRKLDQMIERVCQERGLPKPSYLQYQGNDPGILKLACKSGRMPAVTYCCSPAGRYDGRRIAHMVNLVHADERWFAVLDNNFPGSIEWMNEAEFRRTYSGFGQGWAVILLSPGPPPLLPSPPSSAERRRG
jgi:hypothetical protein